jgi:hypothetical protein
MNSVSNEDLSEIKHKFACTRCSERKVKCNRVEPCSACVRHSVQCNFRPPKEPRKRKRHVEDQVLEARLRRYETLLQERGIDPDAISESGAPNSTGELEIRSKPALESELQETVFKPQIIHGQRGTTFVDK